MAHRFRFLTNLFHSEEKKASSSTEIEFTDFKKEKSPVRSSELKQEKSPGIVARELRKVSRDLLKNFPAGTLEVAVKHKNKTYPSRVTCQHFAKILRDKTRESSSAENIKNLSDFIQTLKTYTKKYLCNTQPKQPVIKEPLSPRSQIHSEKSVSRPSVSSSLHRRHR